MVAVGRSVYRSKCQCTVYFRVCCLVDQFAEVDRRRLCAPSVDSANVRNVVSPFCCFTDELRAEWCS